MVNRAVIQGRVCQDIELRQTPGGTMVTPFAVAVDRYAKAGEERKADFFDVVCWGKTAEFASRYFAKGQMLAIDGRLQARTWEDKDGNKRKAVEIVAEQLHFCGSKQQDSAGRAGDGPAGRTAPAADTDWAPRDRQLYSLPPSGYGNGFAEMGVPEDDLPF